MSHEIRGVNRIGEEIKGFVQIYICEEDLEMDKKLILKDIALMKAHSIMLWSQGLLNHLKLKKILSALNKLEKLNFEGKFKLKRELEDVHMNIEDFVIKEAGMDAGGMMLFARSRNDQVLTDIRMHIREELIDIYLETCELIEELLKLANRNLETFMPYYTHMQPAQPGTFAHLCLRYVDSFLRVLERLNELYERVNVSPFGSGAASGVDAPINRFLVAQLLGFKGVQENTLDCVSSRGELEAECLFVSSLLMTELSRLCNELILFSTKEFGFIELGEPFTTGSSLMPQKRNPDVAEIVRGRTGRVYSYLFHVLCVIKDLISGYSRDMQETKASTFKGFETVKSTVKAVSQMIKTVKVYREEMFEAAIKGDVTAADLANLLVSKDVSFKQAYMVVKELIKEIGNLNSSNALDISEKIEELTEDMLGRKITVTEREVMETIDLKRSVERRNLFGGPSPRVVKEMVIGRFKRVSMMKREAVDKKREIKDKIGELNRLTDLLIEGRIKEVKETLSR